MGAGNDRLGGRSFVVHRFGFQRFGFTLADSRQKTHKRLGFRMVRALAETTREPNRTDEPMEVTRRLKPAGRRGGEKPGGAYRAISPSPPSV